MYIYTYIRIYICTNIHIHICVYRLVQALGTTYNGVKGVGWDVNVHVH